MLQHVLAADIGNDRQHRTRVGDVRKILIGPNSNIDAAGFYLLLQLTDYVEIRRFVGNKIVRIKVPLGFRPLANVLSKLLRRYLNVGSRTRLLASPRYSACADKEGNDQPCGENRSSVELRNGR